MADGQGHWRWNSDTTWHYFCSMQYEAVSAANANNDFMRYHHLRSCIYYATSVLESLLNKEMRRSLEKQRVPEGEIKKRLRYTKLDEKLEKWPTIIAGRQVSLSRDAMKIFEDRQIRNEVTHPKRRDHSIYAELDRAEPMKLVDAVARSLVAVCEAKGAAFQYWVLGWNYVGMNGNAAYPCELNNMNGFVWSLHWMGFNVRLHDTSWEREFMTSENGYEQLKAALDKYPEDIEPLLHELPQRPRLTRRWWDHQFIYENVGAALGQT
jgi:hypothetical protein